MLKYGRDGERLRPEVEIALARANAAATSANVVGEIRFAIAQASPVDSVTKIPAGARVITSQVEIVTPYVGGDAAPTINVGGDAAPASLQSTAALDNVPTAAGLYDVPGDFDWGGVLGPVRTTIGGAPVAGAGFVIVRYVVPLP